VPPCRWKETGGTVYVPGYTAHRTVNTGDEPLVYWGILSSAPATTTARSAERNFRQVMVEIAGRRPVVMERADYLANC
jgi:glucose-6-phosphate isomerase